MFCLPMREVQVFRTCIGMHAHAWEIKVVLIKLMSCTYMYVSFCLFTSCEDQVENKMNAGQA